MKGLQSTDRLIQERYQATTTTNFTGEKYPLSFPSRLRGTWIVGTMGKQFLLKASVGGNENQPPSTGWQYYNQERERYEEDGSLSCNFIESDPCCLTLTLNGRAKEVQGKCEGVYKTTGLVSMGREVSET